MTNTRTQTTWSGARHDFQGAFNEQYYYLSPCAGSTYRDMPFSILGKHTPQWGTVQGLDYLTLQLVDFNGDVYYVFVSADLHSYINARDAVDTTYDNNADNPNLVKLDSGAGTRIGTQFTFTYTQSQSNRIDALLKVDDGCILKFYMQGQVWGRDRLMMHGLSTTSSVYDSHFVFTRFVIAAVIQPPKCYRCHICGLCGDFKNPSHDSSGKSGDMETCSGSTVGFTAGWGPENAFAYDDKLTAP